jgi:hypothetical protein
MPQQLNLRITLVVVALLLLAVGCGGQFPPPNQVPTATPSDFAMPTVEVATPTIPVAEISPTTEPPPSMSFVEVIGKLEMEKSLSEDKVRLFKRLVQQNPGKISPEDYNKVIELYSHAKATINGWIEQEKTDIDLDSLILFKQNVIGSQDLLKNALIKKQDFFDKVELIELAVKGERRTSSAKNIFEIVPAIVEASAKIWEEFQKASDAKRAVMTQALDDKKWRDFDDIDIAAGLPAPPVASPQHLLVQDGFDNGVATGWTPLFGTWRVINNQYACISTNVSEAHAFTGDNSWRNYRIAAHIQQQPNNLESRMANIGITGRIQDSGRFYLAQLRDGRARILKLNGDWVELANVPFSIVDNTWYELVIEFDGSRIALVIDGQPIATATDTTFASGGIGLRCAEATEVYYDDISIRELAN